jgi:lysophospholipase L1-like esterase
MKRLLTFLTIAVLAAISLLPAATSAHSTDDNPIWPSFWTDANFDFSSLDSTNSSSRYPTAATSDIPQSNTTQSVTPQSAQTTGTYVALGDSVAAGAGLPASAESCGRSSEAYPHQVASARGLQLVHLACSGATAGDLFTQQRVRGPNHPAQLNAAFAQGTPELITITAGANDVHWNDYFLNKCYIGTCGTSFDSTLADTYLVALQAKLHYLFFDISTRSNGNPPTTILTGYYNPFSSQCSELQSRITRAEIAWLNARVKLLNKTIRDVSAQYSFTTFVPISFSGHDVCSDDPWVQGPNDSAPLHPTTKGQQLIATAIVKALQ